MAKKRHLHNRRRFLAPRARPGNDALGYLNQPQRELHGTLEHVDDPATIEKIASCTSLSDEPEALSPEEWSAHIDKRAKDAALQQQKFEDAQRERARRLLTFEERFDAVVAEARAAKRRIDISSDVRLLRQMVQAGKDVRHLERRLFLLERKVWRDEEEAA